jgi:hypothetical protein
MSEEYFAELNVEFLNLHEQIFHFLTTAAGAANILLL